MDALKYGYKSSINSSYSLDRVVVLLPSSNLVRGFMVLVCGDGKYPLNPTGHFPVFRYLGILEKNDFN